MTNQALCLAQYNIDFVATGSYYRVMKPLKTVGIKELKNNLSSYLREVRSGATVLVSDRNDIVAELHEPYSWTNTPGAVSPVLIDWIQAGVVSVPVVEKQPLELSCVNLPGGAAGGLLEADRKESGD